MPLIKPSASDCNLDCDYCFYLDNHHVARGTRSRRMTLEIAERFAQQYMPLAPDEAMFAWQGGEPTLLGVEFFQKVFEIQKKYARPGQRPVNTFQTNSVLIDDAFAEFFAENEVLIGVSLDGPESIHDRHRINKGGGKTWRKVMNAVERLEKAGAEFNILTVLHRDNVKRAKEIYRYFRSLDFMYMQFIPCVEMELNRRGKPTGKLTKFSIAPEEYTRFLLDLFDIWEEDVFAGHPVSIRFFDSILNVMAGLGPTMCIFDKHCEQQFVLEADGRIYPCDFFVQAKWAMGNILEDDLGTMLDGPKYQAFVQQSVQFPKECGSCQWVNLCNGGCPRNRTLFDRPPDSSNYFCVTYKTFFEQTASRFETIVQRLIAQQQQP